MGARKHNDPDAGVFLPTPKEIARQCKIIRAGWTWATRQARDMRKHVPASIPLDVPVLVQDGRRPAPVDYEVVERV